MVSLETGSMEGSRNQSQYRETDEIFTERSINSAAVQFSVEGGERKKPKPWLYRPRGATDHKIKRLGDSF